MAEAPPRERFHFGPRDRRGLLAGARAGQLAVIAAALVASTVVLRVVQGPARGPAALALVLAAVGSVTWPIGGRSLEEWVPVATRYASRAVVGANRQALGSAASRRARRPPSVLGAFGVCEIAAGPTGSFGVVSDLRNASATAVVVLGGESFALLGETDRTRRVDSWAGVLASVARDSGSIHRLAWIERTLPDAGDAIRLHLERAATGGGGSAGPSAARISYRQLLASEGTGAFVHELYLAVSVRTARERGASRQRRGDDATVSERIATEVALVDERCRRVGVEVNGVLSAAGLQAMLRRGFDVVPAFGAVDWPWPVAFEATWAATRTDGLWHATFWIAEWPRHDVGSDFLIPLLVGSGVRRTVSVVMAPIPPLKAVRTAEHARTSRVADAELRRRHGFALSARARGEHDAVLRREQELALGHGAFRFSAYVTVSAPERDELERVCRQAAHAAALSGLDVRRLYGAQADAFCCTLPTGRGCE